MVESKSKVREDATWLPRFGFEFELPVENKTTMYYGMGPDENYIDLCHNAKMGLYKCEVDTDYVPKIFPQEQGNHTKVKFLKMYDNKGRGLMFTAAEDKDFNFRASRYDINDYKNARHPEDLPLSDRVFVRIDYKVSGVGSQGLQDKYKLSEKEIEFAFSIKPFIND